MLKKNGMKKVQFKHDDEISDLRRKVKECNSKTCQSLKQVQETIKEDDIFFPDESKQE